MRLPTLNLLLVLALFGVSLRAGEHSNPIHFRTGAGIDPPGPCVHFEGDGCLTPLEEPWRSHCKQIKVRMLTKNSAGSWDVTIDGKVVARCPDPVECPYREFMEERVDLYIFTLTIPGYRPIRTVTRSDGVCPGGCNGTMRVQVPNRDIDDTYNSKTGPLRSTGQLSIDLVPVINFSP